MLVNKVAGNFHIAMGETHARGAGHIHQFNPATITRFVASICAFMRVIFMALLAPSDTINLSSPHNALGVACLPSSVPQQHLPRPSHTPSPRLLLALCRYNVSHTIHSLSFGLPYPGQHNPLDMRVQMPQEGAGVYMYYIKVRIRATWSTGRRVMLVRWADLSCRVVCVEFACVHDHSAS